MDTQPKDLRAELQDKINKLHDLETEILSGKKIEIPEDINTEIIEDSNNLLKEVTEKLENYEKVVICMFYEYSKTQLNAKDFKHFDKYIYDSLKLHFDVSLETLKYYQSVYKDQIYEEHILDVSDKLHEVYISFNKTYAYNTCPIFTRARLDGDGGDLENIYLRDAFVFTKKH